MNWRVLQDPFKLSKVLWPKSVTYDKQDDIIRSVWKNDKTICIAGNKLGKDYIAARICILFALTRHPFRIVTTSVNATQLEAVLWGEIRDAIQKSVVPLLAEKGGPLLFNHQHIRKVFTSGPNKGEMCGLSYILGIVSKKGEGFLGHHIADQGDGIPRTLLLGDEACHDDQTEVLTDSGWKLFKDVVEGDLLFTMDQTTRNAYYEKPTKLYSNDYDGEMVEYKSRGTDFLVTPNHKMLWRRYQAGSSRRYSRYLLEPIIEINGTPRSIPRCFKWEGIEEVNYEIPRFVSDRKTYNNKFVPMEDWLKLLGWYLSEGNLTWYNNTPSGINITQKDPTILYELQKILLRLNYNPIIRTNNNVSSLTVTNRGLAEHFRTFGRYSYQKRVPLHVQALTPELIEIFLSAYVQGDGYTRENGREVIYTSSKNMADDLQILAYKCGRVTSVSKRELIGKKAPNGFSRRDGYIVYMSNEEDPHINIRRSHLKKVPYKGKVYCAEVPTYHTLFTRRNGVCLWSGNSAIDDSSLEKVETWANRQLYIGNAFECSNMFFKESEAGDVPDPATTHSLPEDKRYYTKVIRITGHDSPNVRYAKAYENAYGKPTNKLLIPGVLPYYEYKKWLATWDKIRISVSIDAQFYKGSELLLFPPEWLNHAHQIHRDLRLKVKRRRAVAIGCDPGEGAAESAWAVVDEYGVLETIAYQTKDTSEIPRQTLALMRKYDVPAHMVMFDYGGGGIQHANNMRSEGYHVRTVGFGEPVQPPPKRGQTTVKHQIEQREEKYFYKTRRVEMYGKFSELLNPAEIPDNGIGFGIPDSDLELRRQLALIPKKYGKEGELWLPPKNKKDKNSKEQTLIDIIGCSPDRADALVVAIYAATFSPRRATAGVA